MTIRSTVTVKTGDTTAVLLISDAGVEMEATGVLHWAWSGKSFYFWPMEQNTAVAVAQCNALGSSALTVKAAVAATPKEYQQAYADCGTDSDGLPVYPSWKLLGFFEPSACAGLSTDAVLNAEACTASTTAGKPQRSCWVLAGSSEMQCS